MGIPPEMLVNITALGISTPAASVLPWYLGFAQEWYQPLSSVFIVPGRWFANMAVFALYGLAMLGLRVMQILWDIICFVTKSLLKVDLNAVLNATLLSLFKKLIK